MTGSLYLSPEELLAERDWLRGLARSLVEDQHLAEDAVQETCIRALRAAPRDRSRIRQWLASILRNLVRQQNRSDRTRRTHETAHAAIGSNRVAEPTLDLVERVSVQHRVVAAVLGLDDAHRSVVLLRFFEGLPQRAIAARLDLPVATVNSQLTRALKRVRGELDRESRGGRHEWLAAVAPLTLPSKSVGVFLMQAKLQLAAAALVVGGLIYWFVPGLLAPPTEGGSVTTANTGGDQEASRESAAALPGERRTSVPDIVTPRPSLGEDGVAPVMARGLVVFAEGSPAPDVAVGFEAADASVVRTDAEGRFEVPVTAKDTLLVAKDSGYVTVMKGAVSPRSSVTPVVVIAHRLTLEGQVVTTGGEAIDNAALQVILPEDFESRLPQVLDRSQRGAWLARSAADGSFALTGVPAIEGMTLLATRQPYQPVKAKLAAHSDHRVYLVMGEDDAEDGAAIVGRVLDPTGQAVPDAFVASGLTSTLTDANGNFRIIVKRAGLPKSIRAVKSGFAIARFTPTDDATGKPDWPEFVELRLSGKAKSISGRVLDAKGKPLAGALVWTPDAELFGLAGVVPMAIEFLSAGGEAPRQRPLPKKSRDNPLEGDGSTGGMWHAKKPSASWYFAKTDRDGRFTLPGLQDRKYRVRAMNEATTQMVTSNPLAAGSQGAELQMQAKDVHDSVGGTLLLPGGKPASGISISVFCNVRDVDTRVPGGRFVGELIRHGGSAKTDAKGRFKIADVPARGVRLSIFGDGIIPRFFRFEDGHDVGALRIEVRPRYHVEIVLADASRGDAIRGENASGRKQYFSVIRSGSMKQVDEMPVHRGRTGVLVVPHTLTSIVLLKSGNEVARTPVTLAFGKTLVVRF